MIKNTFHAKLKRTMNHVHDVPSRGNKHNFLLDCFFDAHGKHISSKFPRRDLVSEIFQKLLTNINEIEQFHRKQIP